MVIRKGTHSRFRIPRIIEEPFEISYKVRFRDSCKYTLPSEDQLDINKLFGIGYFSWKVFYMKKFGFIKLPWVRPFHHVNSVRFGWRYNPSNEKSIEILAYWYDDGVRMSHSMGFVNIGVEYLYSLSSNENGGHHMSVSAGVGQVYFHLMEYMVSLDQSLDIGYSLGLYFGGNQTAPHNMEIIMDKA